MEIELSCPCCSCGFCALADTPEQDILDRMIEEGTWYALANGETFEDMVQVALNDRGQIRCPECRAKVIIRNMDSPLWIRELRVANRYRTLRRQVVEWQANRCILVQHGFGRLPDDQFV